MQGNARIGSESILASCCVSSNVDAKMTQRNALFSVIIFILNRSLQYQNLFTVIIVLYLAGSVLNFPFITLAISKLLTCGDDQRATVGYYFMKINKI